MGMTIEEALKIIKDGRIMPYIIKGNNKDDTEFNKANIEALHVIVNIMRKYQKIQEIYQWAKDRSYLVEADDIMDKLKEVVEDGNDTTNTGSN